MLSFTEYVPRNRQLIAAAKRVAKGLTPEGRSRRSPGTSRGDGVRAGYDRRAHHRRRRLERAQGRLPGLRASDAGDAPRAGDPGAIRLRVPAQEADAKIDKTVQGQSHAWIEAWTGGWWDIDPTNNTPITEQHVSVGIGRDYADVSPLKGVYTGGKAKDLDVIVEITRLA